MNTPKTAALALVGAILLVPLTASAESGFFFGGSIGAATLDDTFDGFGVDTDSTSFRLNAGWQFSDSFALEAGYHDFGKFDEELDIGGVLSDVDLRADGYTLGLTAGIPMGQNLSLFGRAGAFIWEGEARLDGFSVEGFDDENLYYGGGASFKVSEQLSLIGDWTRYELDETESDVISIGFRYRF